MSEIQNSDVTENHFTPRILTTDEEFDLLPGFTPLRLSLHPMGTVIDVTRPEVVVGRHSTCDVRLPLPDVSRRHCRLRFQAGHWWVQDCGSLNGVFVNDAVVESRKLMKSDRLRVGGFTFIVQPTAEQLDEQGEIVLRSIAVALSPEPAEQRRAS
jgi:pSer/pThr/pTyr-binding forkhead associated (FHA) protein